MTPAAEISMTCLLYADDLVIIAETINELLGKLSNWKSAIESKGLRVNMGKTMQPS